MWHRARIQQGLAQVPRFTTMLRTFASQHLGAAAPDVAQQYLARAAQLEQKRQQQSNVHVRDSAIVSASAHALDGNLHEAAAPRPTYVTHTQGTAVGGSKLAISILGPWQSAPKAARDAYERFVVAVSALLGGEASSEEVLVYLHPHNSS